jgi:hypothetical protein
MIYFNLARASTLVLISKLLQATKDSLKKLLKNKFVLKAKLT